MRTLLQLLIVLAGGYVIVCAVMFVFQERLLYLPNIAGRTLVNSPADIGLDFEDVRFEAGDGTPLHGWLVPAPDERGTVIFLHGNAGNISHRLDTIRLLHRLGMTVFIFDYRGYGQSEGRPDEPGTYSDAEGAWREVVHRRGVAPERVVLFGRSLGAAVAARQATQTRPGGLILESAFTSVPELGQQLYPLLPVRLLARLDYDTRAYVGEVSSPVLIVHSRDDEIVPFSHARRLYDAAPQPRALLELRGGHNDGFLVTGPDYSNGLDAFLARHLDGH